MGDSRDPAGFVQKPPPAEWNLPAPALTPEQALKTFRLPPGFRIEVVASEPLVHDPIALDFDAEGRLWVVEMRSYMPNVDGRGEQAPINRVLMLEDTDGDGRMDKSTVYMEGLGLVRAIKVLHGGVLIGDPPHLWFTRDTNGDGRADEKISLAQDFARPEMNPEVAANALLWGMDNWIGGALYERRLRRVDGQWVDSPAVVRGQWGQTMDDYGRMFTNSNESYARADLVPNRYPARNPNLVIPVRREGLNTTGVYFQLDANQEVWSARVNPGVNRGYQEGLLRPDGTLKNFTASCGPTIYRGDNFPPEFYGNYFAPEPAANVVRRAILTEKDGIIRARNAYEKKEFLASSDERFRPVNTYTAPDGTLYVIDLYRGILQHRQYMTSYLRRQILERGLDKPVGLGRIYRIVHESKRPGPAPALAKATPAQLVAALSHPNGWWRDTAQRLLVERAEKSAAPELRKLALASSAPVPTRLHALWTLEGLGALDGETVARMMDDAAPKLRAAAVRLSEPALAAGDSAALERVGRRAADHSREVRLQVALSLGEAKAASREAIFADLLAADPEAPFIVPAVVSGLAGREFAFVRFLAAAPGWRESRPGLANVFETLAAALAQGGDAGKLDPLFALIRGEDAPRWQRLALLGGVQTSTVRKVTELSPQLQAAAKVPDPEIAKGATELLNRFVWPGKFGAGPIPLTSTEQRLFEKGRTAYATICA
ncbi:MAG: hypothetical protein RIQ93_1084, partial [Verrucomicrobiota bacterium]